MVQDASPRATGDPGVLEGTLKDNPKPLKPQAGFPVQLEAPTCLKFDPFAEP